jgi:transcriptional regulator with XRE-family HTH domain
MPRFRNARLTEKIVLKIKKLREQKGVTLQEFYNDTGIHLARIESEKRDLPISALHRICEYFGLTLQEFFKGI